MPIAPIVRQLGKGLRNLGGRRLDLLKAHKVRLKLLDELEQLRLARTYAVDVPGCNPDWLQLCFPSRLSRERQVSWPAGESPENVHDNSRRKAAKDRPASARRDPARAPSPARPSGC